jgi:hypothetical protein
MRKLTIVFLILVALLLAKLITTLLAMPKISIDYVSKYNELTKPAGYIPENNAADDCLKAGELYVAPPDELYRVMAYWEDDHSDYPKLNPDEMILLENWIQSNEPALDRIRIAAQKPYAWYKRESQMGTSGMILFESEALHNLSQALLASARLNAIKGDFRPAIDDLVDGYRLGKLQCHDNFSVSEQYSGVRINSQVAETAFAILSYSTPSEKELEYFQKSLQGVVDRDAYVLGLEAEKLCLYDTVQRMFLDSVRGINKASFRILFDIRCMCGDNNGLWLNAFTGPTREEVLKQIDRHFALHNQLRDKTPWEIHTCYAAQVAEIDKIDTSNFFMEMCAVQYLRLFSLSREAKTRTDALMAVLAVLRFKDHNHRLPETLNELLLAGYIQSLPQDPYSDHLLVYKVTGDEFMLYSCGEDFVDNRGEPVVTEETQPVYPMGPSRMLSESSMMRHVRKREYKDIIYWPIIQTSEIIVPDEMPSKEITDQRAKNDEQ